MHPEIIHDSSTNCISAQWGVTGQEHNPINRDPQFKKDLKVFGCIQREAAKLGKGMEASSYEEQLRIWGLSGLEGRKLRDKLTALSSFLKKCREKNED